MWESGSILPVFGAVFRASGGRSVNKTGNIRLHVGACRRPHEQALGGHMQLERVVPHDHPTEARGQQMPSIDYLVQLVEHVSQAPKGYAPLRRRQSLWRPEW